ncbi:acetyl-CoA carboxylase biotin carboxyl carrier protein [Roseococcus thiosulfatophilus]|uniref:acetyl-CoA carboxylase biotin carboxyl carrier protein n=1 Tax=Roseococcus thiosulfatophilus TaxID=35813 RepID=UPI001A8E5C81|nr:acetyl-CoA carboxylase biotin carboxyl carrier protein [Roseococcus thiosulfatophilus]
MTSGIQFDPEAIRRLADILRETDLTEIELSEKDARIRVARVVTVAPAAPAYYPAPQAPAPAPVPVAPVAAAAAAVDSLDPKHPGLVTSPMVGVAYLAPEPGAAPFVSLGSKVAVGQTLLLIEAMKTFNQIKATRAGTVTRILVEAGTPVEYGEPLVLVE